MTATQTARPIVAPEDSRHSSFRPDIQGLRAIAVIVVVLSHVGVPGFEGGYVGVDVFFVISGFLITGLLLGEAEVQGAISISGFYARRIRRILPAATIVLITVLLVAKPLLGAVGARPIFKDGVFTALFAANFRFTSTGTDYFASTAPPSPLQHFWSLAVEEQFYLIWPLLILVLALIFSARMRTAVTVVMAVIVVASLTWCIIQTRDSQTIAYFSPLTRAWELGIGALLAALAPALCKLPFTPRYVAGWTGLIAIVLSVIGFDSSTQFPGFMALIPVLGAAGVLVAGSGWTSDGQVEILTFGPLQYIGLWSYSWYLWHWPILVLAERHANGELNLGTKLSLAALALALAAVTYYLIENPIRTARSLREQTGAVLTIGVALIAFSVLLSSMQVSLNKPQQPAAVVATSKTFPSFVNQRLTLAAVKAAVKAATTNSQLSPAARAHIDVASTDGGETTMGQANCLLSNTETWVPGATACTYGDVNDTEHTIALWGDSHAAMWQPALDLLGRVKHFKVTVYTRGSCPVPSVHAWDAIAGKPFDLCDTYRRQVIAELVKTRPDVIIMASNHEPLTGADGKIQVTGYEAEWGAGLTRTIHDLKPAGSKLLILGDLPRLDQPAPECLSKNVKHPGNCITLRAAAAIPAGHEEAEIAAAKKAGIEYVSMMPLLCTQTKCPAIIGDSVVYQDRFHLTGRYVIYLSPLLYKWIKTAKEPK